jgi:hypothetical protein
MKPNLNLIAFSLFAITASTWVGINSCNSSPAIAESKRVIPYETCDTNFYNGEVLLPDMVHHDTLIVVDAGYLNKCMADYDIESDADISDILSVTTKKYFGR